jgi:hypothetical protein
MKIIKIIVSILATLCIVAIVSKPTYKRFTEFGAELKQPNTQVVFRKKYDYLIFSTFEKEVYKSWDLEETYKSVSIEKYIGCLFNFYKIEE